MEIIVLKIMRAKKEDSIRANGIKNDEIIWNMS